MLKNHGQSRTQKSLRRHRHGPGDSRHRRHGHHPHPDRHPAHLQNARRPGPHPLPRPARRRYGARPHRTTRTLDRPGQWRSPAGIQIHGRRQRRPRLLPRRRGPQHRHGPGHLARHERPLLPAPGNHPAHDHAVRPDRLHPAVPDWSFEPNLRRNQTLRRGLF